MKTGVILRIILWSIALLALLGLLIAGLLFSWNGRAQLEIENSPTIQQHTQTVAPTIQMHAQSNAPAVTEVVAATGDGPSSFRFSSADIDQISILWACGTVTIVPGGGDQLLVEDVTDNDSARPLYWIVQDRELKVSSSDFNADRDTVRSSTVRRDLSVTVPVEWVFRELELNTVSAHLAVRELTIADVDVESTSGGASFENCTVNELSVDTDSGDVEFSGSLGELDMDSASGSFKGIFASAPNEIEIDSASGSLDLTLPEDCGYTVTMDGLSNDLLSDFDYEKKGKTYVYGSGSCDIHMESASGNVTLRKAAQ